MFKIDPTKGSHSALNTEGRSFRVVRMSDGPDVQLNGERVGISIKHLVKLKHLFTKIITDGKL